MCGFTDKNGHEVSAGDRVLHTLDGRTAILEEAFQDGDAWVIWRDGLHGECKWMNLVKIPGPA